MRALLLGIPDEKIQKVLKTVDLTDTGKKKAGAFSLGMKQRLGIAAAIMEKPDILVLDEPTNALDDSGVKLVHDIILSEKKRGAAVIISCHDFSLLRSVADVVYCLDNGKLTAQYTAKELSEKLKQEESI